MARKITSRRSDNRGNRTIFYAAGAVAALGGVTYLLLTRNRSTPSGVSSLDTIPSNPAEDRFGNRGEENMVEPLTLREDQILMRDRLNPYDGLY